MTVAPEFNQALVDKLFPRSSFASAFTSPSAPTPNAGVTPESKAALQRLLKENHQRFHIFFNDKRFHNHLSHHLFAAYSIGAPAHVLQAAFDYHAPYQRPAFQSPSVITRENWTKHLGNEDYYNAYLVFFSTEVQHHGLGRTLEQYVFSHEANREDKMFDRFLAGVVHAPIHLSHAPEFGILGMGVEGLALTAVSETEHGNLFDVDLFNFPDSRLASLASALTLGSNKPKPHTDALTVLARVLADERLEAGKVTTFESPTKFDDTVKNAGSIIREYVEMWTVEENDKVIQERLEELQWLVTVMFGLGGWKQGHEFKADFFLVHLVTSDLFIPSVLSLLQPANQVTLLRGYFGVCLTVFVSRGRPAIDVESFFSQTSVDPRPQSDSASPELPTEAKNNPWYIVLEYSVPHQDEHHIKAERALVHGAALYGTRPKGSFKDTELKNAELIDGSLFIRTGGLLMHALQCEPILDVVKRTKSTRTVEDSMEAGWDYGGLGWAESWSEKTTQGEPLA